MGISVWPLRTYAANLELCDPAPTSVLLFIGNPVEEKKTLYIKFKKVNPSIKYKANQCRSRCNPKKKPKQTINKKITKKTSI
jgi:hypothetical protein